MHFFFSSLQTFFPVAALASDYLLLFDHWIITAPQGARKTSTNSTFLWLTVLKTTLPYAFLEPLFYRLMTAVTDNAMWCSLMASGSHVFAVQLALAMIVEGVMAVNQEHATVCLGRLEDPKQPKDKYRDLEGQAQQQSAPSSPGIDEAIPDCQHKTPLKIHLAPMIPAAASAAKNAGLILYTRYLGSEDSAKWLDGFAFGWTVVALLCVFMFAMAVIWNNELVQTINRRGAMSFDKEGFWHMKQRVCCLLLLIIVRAGVRIVLGQPAFLTARHTSDGAKLQLNGSVHAFLTAPDEDGHLLDRIMKKVPAWSSFISLPVSIGAIIYARRAKADSDRAEGQDRAN